MFLVAMALSMPMARGIAAPVTLVEEGGSVDIDLPFEAVTKVDGAFQIDARGTYDGQSIGLRIVLPAAWKAESPDPADITATTLYRGSARYVRLGPESDRFVALLAREYRVEDDASMKMLPSVTAQAVGLGDDPSRLMDGPARVSMKFFLHADDAGRHAQVYTNVDLRRHVVEFHEKDPEYRRNVVRALTEAR